MTETNPLPMQLLASTAPSIMTQTEMLFQNASQHLGLGVVAASLGLHPNTVKRWQDRGKVPQDYFHDLARLLGLEIQGEETEGVDQFYTITEIAELCSERFGLVASQLGVDLNDYTYVEPSAGSGRFLELMPPRRRIGMDIAPRSNGVLRADFLRWFPEDDGRYVVLGNPPFGLRGHLALQFVNHAAKFSDLVGFILPQLFESDGKGVPAKRVVGMKLAHSEKLPPKSFQSPDGETMHIHTVFQVWTRVNLERIKYKTPATCKKWARVYSLSDGGTPSSTRNKKMLYKCDVYLPSTCFGGMKAYEKFEELPHKRGYGVLIHKDKNAIRKLLMNNDWEQSAFPSTNSALNLRTSIIEQVITEGGYTDE